MRHRQRVGRQPSPIMRTLPQGVPTAVGAYSGSSSPSGAFDFGNGVYQWNESILNASARVLRGGSWVDPVEAMLSSTRLSGAPSYQGFEVGFRLANIATSALPG